MVEQVLTRAERGSAGNSFSEQEPISLAEAVGRIVPLSTVRLGGDKSRQEAETPPPQDGKASTGRMASNLVHQSRAIS